MSAGPAAGFPLRLAWRPSRWQLAASALLACLAQAAIWLSGLPVALQAVVALAAAAGAARSILRTWRQPPRELAWPAPDLPARLVGPGGGEAVEVRAIGLRGPIAVMRLRNASGRTRTLDWWPDTLGADGRRALRLARSAHQRASLLPLVAG